jgi:quercetin dioxygenase-like cupin family protein
LRQTAKSTPASENADKTKSSLKRYCLNDEVAAPSYDMSVEEIAEITMEIRSASSFPTRRGSAESFTGNVWQDPIIDAPKPARVRATRVTFEPGARTAWHTHPLGQTLHVLSGIGRVQVWGEPVHEIRAGDTVWIPPGEKHWHGAAPNHSMAHIAFQENLDGVHVVWLEHVTDDVYCVKPSN